MALLLIVAIGLLLRLAVFTPYGAIHADELIQYLERGHRLANGYGLVTWEERAGIRNWLIPQFLAGPLWLGHKIDAQSLWPLALARMLGMSIGLSLIVSAYALGHAQSRRHGLAAAFAIAVWFPAVYYAPSFLSENWAAAAILGGAALAWDETASRRRLVVGGLLISLGVLLRFQHGAFAAVLAIGLVRGSAYRLGWLALGGFIAGLIGLFSDVFAGLSPYSWFLRNIEANLIDGRSVEFGSSPAYFYPAMLLIRYGLIMICAAVLALFCPPRFRLLLLAALVDIGLHSLLPHKELRFIFIDCVALVILAAITTVSWFDRIVPDELRQSRLHALAPFYLWAALAGSSWFASRNLGEFRYPGSAATLFVPAARDPMICGIGMTDLVRYAVPKAMLGRDLPLYNFHTTVPVAPVPDPPTIPSDVEKAANALITLGTTGVPSVYRVKSCIGEASARICLSVRPGQCDQAAGADYELQGVLTRSNL